MLVTSSHIMCTGMCTQTIRSLLGTHTHTHTHTHTNTQIIDVLAEYKKRSEVAKKLINLVVIGRWLVTCGCSTCLK